MKTTKLIIILFLLVSTVGISQNIALTIIDEGKLPVPNAHILVKETQQFLLSDLNGKTNIDLKGKDTLTLEISFVGFVKKTQKVTKGNPLTIILKEEIITLNSFVVTGQYAANSPEKAVQKITIIDKKKIERD